MNFNKDDIAAKSLTNSLKNDKLSHAYLVVSEDSLYCDEFILQFVKAVFCLDNNSKDFKNCGKCKNCTSIEHNNYVDFYKVDAETSIKKEEIQLLKKEFSIKSYYGKKIYWIKDIEKMTDQAANSLLKFLEEPEEDIIAILSCKNTSAILPTIISRCQQIKLVGKKEEKLEEKENVAEIILEFRNKFGRKQHLANIYLLNELKNKEDILDFFEIVNRKIEVGYTSCSSFEDIKNNSQVQEKVLQAIYDIKANVNSVLVLEKFLFSLILDENRLDFLGD